MSAVMSTLSIISGGRRAHRKLANSGRKSGQFSDAGDERSRSNNDLKQRSASLQTLETTPNGGVLNLECLEAKMASIEVSLANSRRRGSVAREQGRELDVLRNALQDKDALIQSLKTQLSASLSAARLAAQAASPLATKRGRGEVAGPLSAEERNALEERAEALKTDLEMRKNNIADLRRRLEKTHVTDNIDSRIQHAELQYKLGREDLELLTLTEQARVLHALIQHADNTDNVTLYSTLRDLNGEPVVMSTEARAGAWGAGARSGPGLYVEWAREHTALEPGDRLVEVNGVSVLSCRSQEELQRALGRAASAAHIVLLRTRQTSSALAQKEATSLRSELGALRAAAEEAARDKHRLRTDNTRLTHRISYLEEQVAELLPTHNKVRSASGSDGFVKATVNKTKKNVTNISITSEPNRTPGSEVQVFQKGPDITAIVSNLPGLEARAAPLAIRPRSRTSHHERDGRAESDAALRTLRRDHGRTAHDDIERAADRIEESIKKTNWAERKTLSIIEQLKKSQRLRKLKKNDSAEDVRSCAEKHHIYDRTDGKVLENAHKSSRRFSKNTRSAKSSEFESECSDHPSGDAYRSSPRIDCHGRHECRPTPPRKPLRLSLHRARSAHSLIDGSESETTTAPRPSSELKESSKKPVKRTHATDRRPKARETGKATPRPSRKLLDDFSACETPAADDLYPESAVFPGIDLHTSAARWC